MCDTTARYRSFRHELNRELVALDGQAEKLHAELTEHVRYNRSLDAFRVQGGFAICCGKPPQRRQHAVRDRLPLPPLKLNHYPPTRLRARLRVQFHPRCDNL